MKTITLLVILLSEYYNINSVKQETYPLSYSTLDAAGTEACSEMKWWLPLFLISHYDNEYTAHVKKYNLKNYY